MGIESKREPGFDARLRHVRIGENRVAEMECHVQALRERLCRLEKMLPPRCNDIERPRFEEDACKGIKDKKDDTAKVCPIDELAKKEKVLRKQIYNMECTEKKYIRQLADLKVGKTEKQQNNANESPNSPTKKNNDIRKERLMILESYSQKLNTNLQGIKKTHANLAQEAQNLSQVLDKTRKSCTETPRGTQNVLPCGQTKEKTVECSCKKVPKCNSCIVCSCDEWEKDLVNNNEESALKTCTIDKKTPLKQCKCHCYEMLSSSDSDESCDECERHQKKPLKNARCCNGQDAESESSDCSNDDNTMYSEKSKCTCFCSKNHSHEDLLACDDNVNSEGAKPERFRGGLDTITTNTIVANLDSTQKEPNDFPSLKSVLFDNLKLVKVDEIREGLERLKIRNRNLKDFLNNLEDPLTLMSKPSEVTSICTQVSSCYTLDMARQTRSGLLTVVKVLEGRCRNKDAIIVALVDELKTGSNNKIRLKGTEPGIEKIKDWKTISPDKKIRRMFTKKDSAYGFALIALILISHMKKSEVISYLLAGKKMLTESSFQMVMFLNESGKVSADFLFDYYEKAKSQTDIFIKNFNSKSNEIISWLTELYKSLFIQVRNNLTVALPYVTDNWIYVISTVGIVSVILWILRFRKIRVKYFKPSISTESTKELNLFQSVIAIVIRFLKILHDHIFSSRIFWLVMGFCCHILWDTIDSNFMNFIDLLDTFYNGESRSSELKENQQPPPFMEEPVCELFEFFSCTWIMSMFSTKLNDLVELQYQIFKDIVD